MSEKNVTRDSDPTTGVTGKLADVRPGADSVGQVGYGTDMRDLDPEDVRAMLDRPSRSQRAAPRAYPSTFPIIRLGRVVLYRVAVPHHKDVLVEPGIVVKVHEARPGEEVPRVNLQVFHSGQHNGSRLFEDVAYDPFLDEPGTWALPQ